MALNDLPPIPFAELEHILPDTVYLRRHCVVAHILPNYHTVLYIDADMGVVNPKRRIEEYIDDNVEITFFDRFYNWEVAAGSYIVRNTKWAQNFLKGSE
ncbi:hypothetical protein COOONC_25822 [Cooperia oncophora]